MEHTVVSHQAWVEARKNFLAAEKAFTQARDRLSQQRRDLPWEQVTAEYVFDGPHGRRTLAELFEGRSQLVVYHFMFAPDWGEGCKSCSFWADNFNPVAVHLNHRDVTMVAISRAPYEKLAAYQKRMGWSFPWYSSNRNPFNYDYGVSYGDADHAKGHADYNYRDIELEGETDLPGISVFYKDDDGRIFHTYSTYGRGIDLMNTAYNYLDLVPKGRDEDDGGMSSWLRRHDEYDAKSPA